MRHVTKHHPNKTRRAARITKAIAEENELVAKIDLMTICKTEAVKLLAIVNKKDFTSDLALQKEAALLYRGIHQKVMVSDAYSELHDNKDYAKFLQILHFLRQEYSQIFSRIPVDVTSDGRPLIIEIERQGYHPPPSSNSSG